MATLEQRGDHRFVVKARLVGLLLANWAVRGMMAIQSPTPIPIAADLSIDTRVLLFALGLLVLTGIAFGLAPAIRASRPDLAVTMRDESSLAVWRSRRCSLRNGLVVLQVAMSFVLLVGAGLFIRSLGNASSIETGFSVDDVAYVRTSPGFAGYSADDARNILEDFVERARALPGVEAASLGTVLPVSSRGTTTLVIDGYEPTSGTRSVEVPFSVVGVVLGVGLSLAAAAGLSGLLFGISAANPVTFAFVGAVMLAVAIGSAFVPALRAAKADPVLALRHS